MPPVPEGPQLDAGSLPVQGVWWLADERMTHVDVVCTFFEFHVWLQVFSSHPRVQGDEPVKLKQGDQIIVEAPDALGATENRNTAWLVLEVLEAGGNEPPAYECAWGTFVNGSLSLSPYSR